MGGGVIFWLGRLLWRGLGFGFRIWVGIPLFRALASVRDLVVGGVGYFGVRFVHGGSTEEVWGVWVVLFCLGCLLWRGLGIGFRVWEGIPQFRAMARVMALVVGNVG